jgi:gamma-glutamyltranspeptidase
MSSAGRVSATGVRYGIASPHHLATEAGETMLRRGGSAIDAALAAAATLTVVYPHMCALGGDVIALVAEPGGRVRSLNGSGEAARRIAVDELRRRAPTMPLTGAQTITVPGAVRAWESIAEFGARLPFSELLAPAIAHAFDGVPVAPSLGRAIASHSDELGRDAGLAAIFSPDGVALRTGDPLRQPALGRSLEAIATGGADALYTGELGGALIDGLRELGSPLRVDDLAAHATDVAAPLAVKAYGDEVLTSPPNSQGIVLLEVLSALAGLREPPDPLGAHAPLLAELMRLASQDRDAHLADPRHHPVPVETLLGAAHVADLLAQAESGAPARSSTTGARPGGDTVAVVAADADGHAASIIQSVFHTFGSGILEPRTGIVCHNRGACFSLDESSPNVIAPGKRPAHTLMPVLIRREGRIVGAHGTMGGRAQPQIHAQLLLRLAAGASPADALVAPRWVVGELDAGSRNDVVLLEASAPASVQRALPGAGMDVEMLGDLDEQVGHAQIVRVEAGRFEAATDPRADGAAAAGDS